MSRQTVRGFVDDVHNQPKLVMEQIKRKLGQGDWKIETNRSGSRVNYVATKDLK